MMNGCLYKTIEFGREILLLERISSGSHPSRLLLCKNM